MAPGNCGKCGGTGKCDAVPLTTAEREAVLALALRWITALCEGGPLALPWEADKVDPRVVSLVKEKLEELVILRGEVESGRAAYVDQRRQLEEARARIGQLEEQARRG